MHDKMQILNSYLTKANLVRLKWDDIILFRGYLLNLKVILCTTSTVFSIVVTANRDGLKVLNISFFYGADEA